MWKFVKVLAQSGANTPKVELSMSTTQERLARAKDEMHEVDLVILVILVIRARWCDQGVSHGYAWNVRNVPWENIEKLSKLPGKITPRMDILDQVEKNFGKTRLETERLQPLGRPMETPNDFDEIVQKLEEMETHIWTDLDTANFETPYSHAMVEFLLNTAPQPILLVPASLSGLE